MRMRLLMTFRQNQISMFVREFEAECEFFFTFSNFLTSGRQFLLFHNLKDLDVYFVAGMKSIRPLTEVLIP